MSDQGAMPPPPAQYPPGYMAQPPFPGPPGQYPPGPPGQYPPGPPGQYPPGPPGQYPPGPPGQYPPGPPGQYPPGVQGQYPPTNPVQYQPANPGQYPSGAYPQYPTGGYQQVPPVSGAPYPGVPVSPTPISVTPISGSPQPEYYQPLKPSRSRVLLPLTVIVVVLVIASTVIAVVKLTGGPSGAAVASQSSDAPAPVPTTTAPGPTPTTAGPTQPAGDPKAQAAAVDALLDASISSRTKLNAAIDLVNNCTLFEKAIGDMRTVGTERQSQIDSVSRFDLSAIPEGEQVRSMLKEALGFSLAADRSFVPWGQARQSSGCSGGGQADYEEAQRQSQNASDAKGRFLGVWNPVASRYGLRTRSSNDI
ncbi:hypothetical protein ACPPVO_53590 [Dactylosporangium sp. McL0621]|uniref:hypothetical protein n=1 Tax=Dactylosporangium sp. McL0621 TaxID=3415678 RepID=UPI003CF758E9